MKSVLSRSRWLGAAVRSGHSLQPRDLRRTLRLLPFKTGKDCSQTDCAKVFAGCAMAAAFGWVNFPQPSCSTENQRQSEPRVTVLSVEGMGCQGCVGRVEKAILSLDQSLIVRVDLKNKLAVIQGDALAEKLIAVVTATGKRAELVGSTGTAGFVPMASDELKNSLRASGRRGVVLDIDQTLSATNVAWFQRLITLFGNPDDLPLEALISQYHLAPNVPFWQSKEALDWMQKQRDDPKAQDDLPLIPNAVQGVHKLRAVTPVVAYCTIRPETVNSNTIQWLRQNGFPDLPVVAKPASVPFADGNKWKAAALHQMWPEVQGIVDDNPKVALFAGKNYPGKIFSFGHASCPEGVEFADPCWLSMAGWPGL